MTEFDIIKKFFATQLEHRADVILGIGDDAALLQVPRDQALVVTTDTLIVDVHFPAATVPYDIGYKALAVNLSDLAAMGATPAWVTMALTLPRADQNWLQEFCEGFFTLANRHQVQLVGGDLTRGPLSITVQAMGFVPPQQALRRSGAKPSDLIYVTGTLGDAGLALKCLQKNFHLDTNQQRDVLRHLNQPEPRIATGKQLLGIAHAAIDISDGLAADLSHILEDSHTGAILYVDQLPLSSILQKSLAHNDAIALALSAGDDYELCFTIPPDKRILLEQRLSSLPCRYTCIGEITQQPGLNLRYTNGNTYNGKIDGYRHF